MEIPEYSELRFYVKGTECSDHQALSVPVLLGNLQETADKGAGDCGFDRTVVTSLNACWIILRMKVHIDRLPSWREEFSIRTWSNGCEKLYFDREYELYDKDSERIGYASSIWILADISNHRPLIPGRIEGLASPVVQREFLVFGERCPKFKSIPADEVFKTKPVITKYADYSELDHNHHVNNTRYMAWVLDALYKIGEDVSLVHDFDITYIAEVKSGEKVDIYVMKTDYGFYVTGYKDEGVHVFDSEIFLSV